MKNKKLIIIIVAIVLLIAIGVGVWYFFIREEETPDTDGDDKNEPKNDGKLDKGEALELAGGLLSDLGKKL